MKKVYLLLLIIGAAIPLNYLVQFIMEFGFDFSIMVEQLLGNNITRFFTSGLLFSSICFLYFMYIESGKHKIYTWWICVIALFTIGLSLALPLFLYIREDYIDIEKLNGGSVKL